MIEPELASVLKQTRRDINTLSAVLRSGRDGRPLAILTRTAPPGPRHANAFSCATPEHHHSTAILPLSRVHTRARAILLDHVHGERHDRDRVRLREPVDLLHVRAADL